MTVTVDAPDLTAIVGDERATWNNDLRSLGGHLLQSWEWGEFKARHGWNAQRVRVETRAGAGLAQILFRRRGPVSLAYVPRGPVLAGETAAVFPHLMEAIDAACTRQRAFGLIVEPDQPLGLTGTYKAHGFVRGPAHFQPARTVKVPLLPDEALLNQMHQKTRYSVRLAQRRGVVVERGATDDASLATFYGLLEDTAQRNAFGVHAPAYYADFLRIFGDHALLLFALIDGVVAAGLIAARFGREAIYMYGGSSTEHRAHGAAFLLQFEAMRWARENGCERYDLWGIPAQDPGPSSDDGQRVAGTRGDDWRGLYKFKVGFGGEIVRYPPTLERRYQPALAWLARRTGRLRG